MNKLENLFENSKSFVEIQPLIEKAEVKLSILGRRYLRFPNSNYNKEYIYLDYLAGDMVSLAKHYHTSFVKEEITSGREIKKLVDNLYDKGNILARNANFITRFFIYIFESLPYCEGYQWKVLWIGEDLLSYLSKREKALAPKIKPECIHYTLIPQKLPVFPSYTNCTFYPKNECFYPR